MAGAPSNSRECALTVERLLGIEISSSLEGQRMDSEIQKNDLLAMVATIIQEDLRPLSRKAVNKRLQRAVKSGRVQKKDVCARCGKPGYTEAHHWDYSQPLVVEWLCRECHKVTHVLIRAPRLAGKRAMLRITKCSSGREEGARIYRGDFQVVLSK